MSILFLGIITTYVQIQRLLNSQSIASMQGQQAEELYEILSHDLQNIVYEKWNKKYFFLAKKNLIGGSKIDSLNFISGSIYTNPLVFQSRIYNVTYFGKINNDNGSLTLFRKEDMFADYKETSNGVPIPVLNKITKFLTEFSLNGEDWQDTWDPILNKNLPTHIRITIQYIQDEESGMNERKLILQTSPGIFM